MCNAMGANHFGTKKLGTHKVSCGNPSVIL